MIFHGFLLLAGLHHGIEQGRFAGFDSSNRSLQSGAYIMGFVMGPSAYHPILCAKQRSPYWDLRSRAGRAVVRSRLWRRHRLQMHHLLVITTIVVHDGQHRNPVMCRRQERRAHTSGHHHSGN